MKTLFPLLIIVLILPEYRGNIIDADDREGECKGSVTLYEGSEETVVTEDQNVKVTVDKVKVEGCGCFQLHNKKNGKGRSYFLGRGEHTGDDIGWKKVRSVRKVECESRAMPVWGVVVIVVVLVGIMAVGAVFGIKKYRDYGRVNTEWDSSVL
jgi:hypothetical protein